MRKSLWRLERAEARNTLACAQARAGLYNFSAEYRWIAGGYAIFAGHWTHLTQAVAVGISGEVRSADITVLRDYFLKRLAVPTVHVSEQLPDVLQVLQSEGFRRLGEYSILARRTAGAKGSSECEMSAPTPAWIGAAIEGFGSDEVGHTLARTRGTKHFLVRGPDGEVQGTAAFANRSRVAVCFADSTPERFRGQGVQSRLIRGRIAHAAQTGCDLLMAVTESGSGSERNYMRHGFTCEYRRVVFQFQP